METTTPDQTSRDLRFGGAVATVICVMVNLGLAALVLLDLVNAHENQFHYPFGAENAGWTYRSLETYTAHGAGILAVLAAAIAAVTAVRSYLLKLALGFAPIPLLLLVNEFTGTA